MDIKHIVKSAVAIATLEFQDNVNKEKIRLTNEEDYVPVWAHPAAIEKFIPKLVEDALIIALSQIIKERE